MLGELTADGLGYLEEEAEADPLVVFVIPPFQRILGLVHPRVCNIKTDPLPEGTEDQIGSGDGIISVFRSPLLNMYFEMLLHIVLYLGIV